MSFIDELEKHDFWATDKSDPSWKVQCYECGWEGLNIECETEQDYESWEMSHITWTNFLCPICGEITDEA